VSVTVPAPSRVTALALVLLSACGGGGSSAPSPTQTAAAATTAAATSAPQAGAITFNVDPASKATVRVREQLARVPAPSNAVLTITGAQGSFALNPDGSFSSSSKISVDMTTISSDESRRDDFIKRETLETSRFPTAELVPKKVSGLALPLAASGDFAFTLTGDLTLHGVTKSVTFDVKSTRSGSKLTATATANPSWKFGDFGMTVPSALSVLSIVDEIRVEFALVANEARA
jgi:polyisoprenoid-binding protein YceI